jgi:hypothetical protein
VLKVNIDKKSGDWRGGTRKDIPEKGNLSKPVVKAYGSGDEIVKSSIKPRVGKMALTGTRLEEVKFDGSDNFGLWQTRVKDVLAQQGISEGLQRRSQTRWTMKIERRYTLLYKI